MRFITAKRGSCRAVARCLGLVVCVGLLVVSPAVGAASVVSGATFADSLGGGYHFTATLNMFGGSSIPDAATAASFARDTDIIVAGSMTQLNGYGGVMRQANPNLQIFVYYNGMQSASSGFPAAWYMKDKAGNRIKTVIGNMYLMNPAAQAPYTSGGVTYASWTSWAAHGCANALSMGSSDLHRMLAGHARNRTAGLQLQPKRRAALQPHNREHLDDRRLDQADRHTRLEGILDHRQAGHGQRPFQRSSLLQRQQRPALLRQRRTRRKLAARRHRQDRWRPSIDQWKQNVQMLIDAGSGSKALQVTTKTWTTSTTTQREAWRRYALASFMLGNSGHDYFQFSPSHTTLPWNDDSPLYHLSLGTPTQTATTVDGYLQNGVYSRTYTNGIVLVNPSQTSITINLPQTYYTTTGTPTTTITLPPGDGNLLTSTP